MDAVNPTALPRKPVLPELVAEGTVSVPIGRPARRRPARRTVRRASAVAAVLVLVAMGGFSYWDRHTVHSGGPVDAGGLVLGAPRAVGEPTSFGWVKFFNHSRQPAVLDRVRITGLRGGFEILAVRTVPSPAGMGDEVTPPSAGSGTSLVLHGSRLVPPRTDAAGGASGEPLDLQIVARASRPGLAQAQGVEIEYHIGRRRYRRATEGPVFLCAPAEAFTAQSCTHERAGGGGVDVEIGVPD